MASAPNGPLFISGGSLSGAADLESLDFQLLNDYLFDDTGASGGFPDTHSSESSPRNRPRDANLADNVGSMQSHTWGAMSSSVPKQPSSGGGSSSSGSRAGNTSSGGNSNGGGGGGGNRGGNLKQLHDDDDDVGGNAALDGDLAALASTDEEDDEEGADGVKRPKVNGNSDRPKTKAQVDRRRERNRILARRTRLRKKFFFESLQKQVTELQRENHVLKDLVKVEMAGDGGADEILAKCQTDFAPVVMSSDNGQATSLLEKQDFNLMRTLQSAQRSFVITDPYLPDNPIVFASQEFLRFTGYSSEQVLGRNCRFLQGPKTSSAKVAQIRTGILEGTDVSVCLLNYRADGTTFWNQFFVAALRDGNNRIVNYVGVQCPVGKPPPGDDEYEESATIEASSSVDKPQLPEATASAAERPKMGL